MVFEDAEGKNLGFCKLETQLMGLSLLERSEVIISWLS